MDRANARVPEEQYLKMAAKQIMENEPPETRETFHRLVDTGISRTEARRLIACVVSSENLDMLKETKPFNRERYIENLNALPTLPWEK